MCECTHHDNNQIMHSIMIEKNEDANRVFVKYLYRVHALEGLEDLKQLGYVPRVQS